MKSSTGRHYIGLDHIRALAAFIVFSWHFIHVNGGNHAPPPVFPLSLFSEGHTGVALFMVLSGYLFAKLLDGKKISFPLFLWNRFIRLAPLLLFVFILVGLQNYTTLLNFVKYLVGLKWGLIIPSWPNGGWSLTAEFHFYLILPFLLFLKDKWRYSLLAILVVAILIRMQIYQDTGNIQKTAYMTIIGRVDQFLLGILAFQFRNNIAGKHLVALVIAVLFLSFIYYFDMNGGFYENPSYPSPSSLWIYMPTIEGVAYATLIAWYDNSFTHSTNKASRFIALIGTYSYSIYLFHFFFVFEMSQYTDQYIMKLDNLETAIFFSFIAFFLMIPISFLSYKYIESPFLKLRKRYIKGTNTSLVKLR